MRNGKSYGLRRDSTRLHGSTTSCKGAIKIEPTWLKGLKVSLTANPGDDTCQNSSSENSSSLVCGTSTENCRSSFWVNVVSLRLFSDQQSSESQFKELRAEFCVFRLSVLLQLPRQKAGRASDMLRSSLVNPLGRLQLPNSVSLSEEWCLLFRLRSLK
jgi:hypothetical protein